MTEELLVSFAAPSSCMSSLMDSDDDDDEEIRGAEQQQRNKLLLYEESIEDRGRRGSSKQAETSFDQLLSQDPSAYVNAAFQGPAPQLTDDMCYHLMFLHHPNESLWVEHVIDKLQQYEYKCCYIGQCHRDTTSIELEEIMLLSERIVIVITADLVSEFMYNEQEVVVRSDTSAWLTDLDIGHFGGKDAIGLWLHVDCDIPTDLCKLPLICVDDHQGGWWGQFVDWVISSREKKILANHSDPRHQKAPEEIETSFVTALTTENGSVPHHRPHHNPHHTVGATSTDISRRSSGSLETLDMEVQGTSTTAGLESGVLVTTVRSQWKCFGREVFEKKLPEEFCYCQLQLSPDDFNDVIDKMMSSRRLRWHACLFSAPCISGGMVLLLLLCLIGVPLIEDRLIFHDSQLGFEFVHGLVLWMLLLSFYLATAHFLKLKVTSELNDRLTDINTILVRSNILATLEELGILEYSKLAIHFFYFEIGPCLGYLQDMIEPSPACNGVDTTGNAIAQSLQLTERNTSTSCDMVDICDTSVLDTNAHTQHNAEDLIIEHSSQYLNTLLSGRLRTPVTPRHLHQNLCLCQYLEYRLSNKSMTL